MNLTITRKCSFCNTKAINFGVNKYAEQVALCEECTELLEYEYCGTCDEYVPNTVRVLEDYKCGEGVYEDWCPWCVGRQAWRCSACRQIVNRSILVKETTCEGINVCMCQGCIDETYVRCAKCGDLVLQENAVIEEDEWGSFHECCKNCA